MSVLLRILFVFQDVFYFAIQQFAQSVDRLRRDMPSMLDRVVRRHGKPELAKPVGGDTSLSQRPEKRLVGNHSHLLHPHHKMSVRACVDTEIRIY